MSTRYGFAVLALASIAGAATVASPLDLEGRLAPRLPAPNTAATPRPVAVRLVWTDPARAAVGLERLARAEAEDVLRKMGVSVTWRHGDAGELARPGEVRVILLDRPAARDPEIPVLGATPPTFAASPFVWVHVPGVRRHVPHVTRTALRRELADLEGLGLVYREAFPGSSRRAKYSLTPLGETLRPVVGAMYEWGLLRLGLERRAVGGLSAGKDLTSTRGA